MLDKLERKIGWIAFPSIIKYLAFFQLGVVGLSFMNPAASQLLDFNWQQILAGELWRPFTFIFSPVGSLSGPGGGVNAFFAIFAALLLMTFGDGLEGRWGAFRTTLFFLCGWLCCLLTSILISVFSWGVIAVTQDGVLLTIADYLSPGIIFDAAILFAFATYYPRFTIRLFFILPVPIVIIAIVSGIGLLMVALSGVASCFYIVGGLLHYLIIVIPLLKSRIKGETRKIKKAQTQKKPICFHTCGICAKRDIDDPKEIFRVTADGQELCGECLEDR